MADADDEPFGEALLAVAEDQLAHHHFGIAVVIAQTVVEAEVELAFSILFGLNIPMSSRTLMALLPDRSFAQRGTRTLWTDLTGDDIKEPRDEWRAYWSHLERRNHAAHGAVISSLHKPEKAVTREGAKASLRAVRDIGAHIDRVLAAQTNEIIGSKGERVDRMDPFRALRLLSPRPNEWPPEGWPPPPADSPPAPGSE
jgi:hypothetical protein